MVKEQIVNAGEGGSSTENAKLVVPAKKKTCHPTGSANLDVPAKKKTGHLGAPTDQRPHLGAPTYQRPHLGASADLRPERVVDLEPIEEEEEQTMSRPDIVLHRNRATPNEEVSTRNSHSAALQPGALQDAVVQPSVTSQVY